MNHVYRIMALSCVVFVAPSFTMENGAILPFTQKNGEFKPSLLADVAVGKFFDNDRIVMSGKGGIVLYNIRTNEEKKLTEDRTGEFAVRGDQIAAVGLKKLMIYEVLLDVHTRKMHEEEWPIAHVAFDFNRSGSMLFVYNTGHIIEIPSGDETQFDGKILIGIDCENYEKHNFTIASDGASSVPGLACHPLKNEIIYASGGKVLSTLSIKNGSIEKKNDIAIPNIMGLISGQLKYNENGLYIGVYGTTTMHGGGELHLYDFEKKESRYYGNVNGFDFYPDAVVPIIAILRGSTAIDYWDYSDQVRVHSTEPLIDEPGLPINCTYTIEFSPDGKLLFVAIPKGRPIMDSVDTAFLIKVPAVVYAYNKAKAERK